MKFVIMAFSAALTGAVAMATNAAAGVPLRAEIRTTSHGVAHVEAQDTASLGFGQGYASAKMDICEMAGRWVTVNAQRALYFGPDEIVPTYGDPGSTTNIQSDFYWQWIIDTDVIGRELAAAPPRGPTPEVREMIRGYVAGYNLYLLHTGINKIPDSRCKGASWIRPITEKDVYLRSLHWSMFATSVNFISQFVNAAPPTGGKTSAMPSAVEDLRFAAGVAFPRRDHVGSNMIALGNEATDNGRGMLFANPHWYWNGPERFFENELTIPGKLKVYGISTLGMPMVLLGETEHAAWSHTVSTPVHATVYELQLTPGDPTSYVYDGKNLKLQARSVSVRLKSADGKIAERKHTFWATPYGLVLQDKTFGWNAKTAFSMRDVAMNLYWMNKAMALDHAQSVEEIKAAGARYLGIPWLNTIAADSTGQVLYADNTAVPHVTDQMLASCVSSPLGKQMLSTPMVVLDGWRSDCAWGSDADSIEPGTFGTSKLPQLARTDYVTNSNDSNWTNNPHHLLEGYPKIMGPDGTVRTLRTRMGLEKIEARLAGKDGYPGNRFTLANLQAITLDNRVLSGALWRDDLVALCRTLPSADVPGSACDVLAKWDLSENIDSAGAVLWRRFFESTLTKGAESSESIDPGMFAVPFDRSDPMHTPRGLNVRNPKVASALEAAIADLRKNGIALDAPLRAFQYADRNGAHIPIPGGPGATGQFNAIDSRNGWTPPLGWPDVFAGSSFIMWTQFTDQGPVGRSILTYSQSNSAESPYHSDQTKLFSEKKSKAILFTDAEISADHNMTLIDICFDGANTDCK